MSDILRPRTHCPTWPSRLHPHIPHTQGFTTYQKQFTLVISRVNAVRSSAWLAQQLPAVDINGCKDERAVGVVGVAAVLPLHDAARAGRVLRVGDGAVVRFLVVAVVGEGVGDAGAQRLD